MQKSYTNGHYGMGVTYHSDKAGDRQAKIDRLVKTYEARIRQAKINLKNGDILQADKRSKQARLAYKELIRLGASFGLSSI